MKKTQKSQTQRHLLAIGKANETFIFAFDEPDIKEAVAQVIRLALDGRFSFDYSDLLTVLRQLKRLIPSSHAQRLHPHS